MIVLLTIAGVYLVFGVLALCNLCIPTSWIRPVFSLQWGFGTREAPNLRNIRVLFFSDTPSFYMNGVVFFGIQFPFCVQLMVRWGGAAANPAFVQTHVGFRPINGAAVCVFRVQSDDSAQGGLVAGWEDGAK